MPKVKAQPDQDRRDRTQVSSVIFGLVMVAAIIVAGAALLGGSLSKASQRWGHALDATARGVGLAVDHVEVVGLEHVPATARQVKIAAMVEEGENMFRADPHRIRSRIENSRLVANVRVYRLWPDTVMIRADAAEPVALWLDGGTWRVVDSLGRTMPRLKATDHGHLIKTVGENALDGVPALETALGAMPGLAERVAIADRISSRRWTLQLTDGPLVHLPPDEALADSIAHLARLDAATALSHRDVEKIDLRVPGRVFLTAGSQRQDPEEEAA
ncbi:MAG: FtsQ-type POTRA domain-containing protein [Pseudomonadota bacterium]